jgi:hypothetical protein
MSFTLFLSSSDGIQNESGNINISFLFDWNNSPRQIGKYKVSFTFCSQLSSDDQTYNPLYVYANFGSSSTFAPKGGSNGTLNTRLFGAIYPVYAAPSLNQYFFADSNTNSPILLDSLPTDNNIKIEIKDPFDVEPEIAFGEREYMLSIFFEAIE